MKKIRAWLLHRITASPKTRRRPARPPSWRRWPGWIFAPSFVLVAELTRAVTWLRRSTAMRGFLDGVNASSLALMAAVAAQLVPTAVSSRGPLAVALGATLFGVLARGRVNPSWLVLGGGAAGALFSL